MEGMREYAPYTHFEKVCVYREKNSNVGVENCAKAYVDIDDRNQIKVWKFREMTSVNLTQPNFTYLRRTCVLCTTILCINVGIVNSPVLHDCRWAAYIGIVHRSVVLGPNELSWAAPDVQRFQKRNIYIYTYIMYTNNEILNIFYLIQSQSREHAHDSGSKTCPPTTERFRQPRAKTPLI